MREGEYHPNIYEADWLGNTVMGIKEIPMLKGQGDEVFDGIGNLYSGKKQGVRHI